MSARIQDLVDPSDFCRTCKGSGRSYERTERGTTLFGHCDRCRGTGKRTILVSSHEDIRLEVSQ